MILLSEGYNHLYHGIYWAFKTEEKTGKGQTANNTRQNFIQISWVKHQYPNDLNSQVFLFFHILVLFYLILAESNLNAMVLHCNFLNALHVYANNTLLHRIFMYTISFGNLHINQMQQKTPRSVVRRASKVSQALKIQFLLSLQKQGSSIKQMAKKVGLNYSTAKVLVRNSQVPIKRKKERKDFEEYLPGKSKKSKIEREEPGICSYARINEVSQGHRPRFQNIEIISTIALNFHSSFSLNSLCQPKIESHSTRFYPNNQQKQTFISTEAEISLIP